MSRFLRGAAVAAFVLALAACGNDEGYTTFTVPTAFMRVVNLIPDSPALNVYVNDTARTSQNFESSSSFFQILPDANLYYTVNYQFGTQLVNILTREVVRADINRDLTTVLTGTLDNPTLIRIDNPPLTQTSVEGKVELQFMNAATALDNPVNVELMQGGSVIETDTLEFNQYSALASYDAGDYQITVRDSVTDDILWTSGDFSLSAATRGLIVLADYFGPGSERVRMLTVSDTVTSPFANDPLPSAVRVANLTSDQGPLDVYADGTLIASGIAYAGVSDYVETPTPIAHLVVTPAGDPATVLSDTESLTPVTGSFHTLAVVGLDDTHYAQLHVDDVRRIATRARVVATNAALGTGPVDIYIVDPGVAVTDVSPRISSLTEIPNSTSSQALSLQEGTYDLYVTNYATKTVLYGPMRIDVANSGIYGVYVANPDGGSGDPTVQFTDDFN
ncbi:MAG: DUF4397 domain-containing protein [Pseudomonadales bacterium]|nr:DUF4397 domain-containing protein [Pseudomonadales bacterium]